MGTYPLHAFNRACLRYLNEKPVFSDRFLLKWREWDLNPRPKAYESSALPTELPRHSGANITMVSFFCQRR